MGDTGAHRRRLSSFFPRKPSRSSWERRGGYVNDPNDPGGETKYGITKLEYPNVNIAQLTLADAQQIYQRDYWSKIDADSLRGRVVALVMFDCAVNQGVAAAQAAVHKVTGTSAEFQAERALRYMRAEAFPRFGRGWMRRLFTCFPSSHRSRPNEHPHQHSDCGPRGRADHPALAGASAST